MSRSVDIFVTGIHSREGEPTEKIESIVPGVCQPFDDGSMIIEYDEDQDFGTGAATVHNKVLINSDHDRVEIIRSGASRSRICFGNGLVFDTEYLTPYGSMQMKVRSNNFELTMLEEEIKVLAEYDLEIGGDVISNSVVVIDIKNAETA